MVHYNYSTGICVEKISFKYEESVAFVRTFSF